MHRRSASVAAGGGLAMVASLVTGAVAQASPLTHIEVFSDSGAAAASFADVHNYADGSTPETLADAISYLDNHVGGKITFASSLSGHTIDLTESLPVITMPTTITGLGAGKLAISGGGDWNTLSATGTADLTISDLTVKDAAHGAAYAQDGNLTVTDSVLEGSRDGVLSGEFDENSPNVTLTGDTIRANGGGGVYIIDDATVRLLHCLVEGNATGGVEAGGGPVTITASSIINNSHYGGIYESDQVVTLEPLTIVNSTISGNVHKGPGAYGGGISLGDGINLTLIGDTVTDNEADNTSVKDSAFGGGFAVEQSVLTVEDSVVAGNKVVSVNGVSGEKYPDIANDANENVVKDSLIGAGATKADTYLALKFNSSDQKGTTKHPLNPKLGKLGPEGSKTATAGGRLWVQEPLKGSPLIGKGAAKPFSTGLDPFTTDELGTKRPATGVTIGAYQVPPKKKPKKHK